MAAYKVGKYLWLCCFVWHIALYLDHVKCLEITTSSSADLNASAGLTTAQQNGTAQPENEPEIQGTPEPVSEAEVQGTPEPVSEAEVQGTPEPVSKAEVQGTPEPVSEAEVQGTPEPEGTAEVQGTPEPEVGTSEGTPEPVGALEGTAEPNGTSEPHGTAEVHGSPEPEGISEPGGTGEPETHPERQAEPTNEPESEPESETEPENEPEGEGAVPEERPNIAEVIAPPFTMIAVILIALVCLAVWSKQGSIRGSFKKISPYLQLSGRRSKMSGSQVKLLRITKRVYPEKQVLNDTSPLQISDLETRIFSIHPPLTSEPPQKLAQKTPFLTPFDREVLKSMGASSNSMRELIRIATPALLSLALCPATLYLYEPLVNAFWPFEKGFKVPPDINEAIACFLAPAGLVYATCFGFAFQQALTKQTEIRNKVSHEFGMLDQITTLASKLTMPSLTDKMDIYKAVKAEAIFMVLQIERKEPTDFKHKPTEDVKVKIWSILDILRRIVQSSKSHTFDVDRIIAERIVAHTLELNSICSDRMGTLHARIHPLKWAFLECLGFFSFFGILLLKAESYRVELTMCVVTVFSISLMCYVVSDLDSPFSGFFRIDVTVLHNLVHRVKAMYEAAEIGAVEPLRYPQKRDLFFISDTTQHSTPPGPVFLNNL